MARFDNKVVLISDGARGQGAAEARLLVAEGAKVVIGDVREDEGKKLAAELGNRATFVRHDVTSEAEWAEMVAAAESFGGLHGFVNNAGIFVPKTLLETDADLFERHVRINQFGYVLPTHNPLRVAEHAATLDHMLGGRLNVAFVRGYQAR